MRLNWRNIILSLMIGAWLFPAGCRFPLTAEHRAVESVPSPDAIKAFALANTAYQKGEYALAAERFAAIREETTDRRLALMALFGLACSRFMQAETPEDHIRALELWDTWNDNAPDVSNTEDPRFMDPLIREKMLFSNLPPEGKNADDAGSTSEGSHWLFIRTKQEMDRLREQLKIAQAAEKKHLKKIRGLEKEISKLKRQIIALEAIDQKIQEKKTAIPSADKSTP